MRCSHLPPQNRRTRLLRTALEVAAWTAVLLLPPTVRASLIFVDTDVDELSATTSGDAGCSLREAVHAANTNQTYGSCASGQSGEDIVFVPFELDGEAAIYDLTLTGEGDLEVLEELQIWGTGAGRPQIHAQGIDRIFDVDEDAGTFTLLNLLLRGGDAGAEDGGAIRTHASVATVLEDVRLWDNSARSGGAIYVASSSTPPDNVLQMTDVTFDENEASAAGGALRFGQSSATVTSASCTGCTFNGNSAESGAAISLGGAARIHLAASTLISNESGSSPGTIDGASASWVTLSDSLLGWNLNGGNRGAGYHGSGILILQGSTLRNGIYLYGGTFEATDSVLEGTERTALYTVNGPVVTLTRVRVAESPWSASETAPAVRVDGHTTITDSVFADNVGGLSCLGCDLTVHGSSFVDNVLPPGGTRGGAIYAGGATAEVTVENSTFSGNEADLGGAFSFFGGADFELRNVTITDNAALEGGGIHGESLATTPKISNSVLAGNSAATAGADCASSLASEGWNLVGSTDDCTVSATAGDLFGTDAAPIDAGLAPRTLVDEMPIHGLLEGSPALDAGNPNATGSSGSDCRPVDQVGQNRPVDGGGGPFCDIGAIEETSPGEPLLFDDGFESGDTSGWTM